MLLTPKERQVLEALQSSLYLRRKVFSDLWEIARSMSSPMLTERSRSDALFSVNRGVIERLQERGLIHVVDDTDLKCSRYMIANAGQSAISKNQE